MILSKEEIESWRAISVGTKFNSILVSHEALRETLDDLASKLSYMCAMDVTQQTSWNSETQSRDGEITRLRDALNAGDRLARTIDNFDHHPLAKDALVEYRTRIQSLIGDQPKDATTDTERLDWLIKNRIRVLDCTARDCNPLFIVENDQRSLGGTFKTPRQAIDAAIKAERGK